jgi:deazaflavin-dependent oxidoreductase (nitroreductase family)
MVLRRKVTRAFGALFAMPIAVAGVVLAAYLVLLSWTKLLRVKWVNDGTRRFSKTANRSIPSKIAGTRLGSLYFNLSALHHIGRRSGRAYVTPLGAYPLGDGFVLAVAYDDVDWYHNVLAAGKCMLTWRGQEYALEKPEVISAADALKAYPLPVKPFIVAAGMKKFLWLHRVGSDERDGA